MIVFTAGASWNSLFHYQKFHTWLCTAAPVIWRMHYAQTFTLSRFRIPLPPILSYFRVQPTSPLLHVPYRWLIPWGIASLKSKLSTVLCHIVLISWTAVSYGSLSGYYSTIPIIMGWGWFIPLSAFFSMADVITDPNNHYIHLLEHAVMLRLTIVDEVSLPTEQWRPNNKIDLTYLHLCLTQTSISYLVLAFNREHSMAELSP